MRMRNFIKFVAFWGSFSIMFLITAELLRAEEMCKVYKHVPMDLLDDMYQPVATYNAVLFYSDKGSINGYLTDDSTDPDKVRLTTVTYVAVGRGGSYEDTFGRVYTLRGDVDIDTLKPTGKEECKNRQHGYYFHAAEGKLSNQNSWGYPKTDVYAFKSKDGLTSGLAYVYDNKYVQFYATYNLPLSLDVTSIRYKEIWYNMENAKKEADMVLLKEDIEQEYAQFFDSKIMELKEFEKKMEEESKKSKKKK